MPDYGDIIYNVTDAWVARLNADGTYGTPQKIEYLQTFSFEFETDEDTLKAYGLNVELLSVPIGATGTLGEASLQWGAVGIMTGNAESSSGSTPNEVKTVDMLVGGAGLPYFGLIVSYAATEGNAHIGFAKCKLASLPSFNAEQNTFRTSEIGFNAVAPSTTIRRVARIVKNETAAVVPSTAGGFDTFFDPLFD